MVGHAWAGCVGIIRRLVRVSPNSLQKRRAALAAGWLALIGIVLGVAAGLFISGALTATGVTSADLPPLAAPTTEATTTATPTPTTAAPVEESTGPEPRLDSVNGSVAPGERFTISGMLPDSDDGASLRIEVRDGSSGSWDEFPVTLTASGGGRFETKIWTSRTGERTFRVVDPATKQKTPEIKVTIG